LYNKNVLINQIYFSLKYKCNLIELFLFIIFIKNCMLIFKQVGLYLSLQYDLETLINISWKKKKKNIFNLRIKRPSLKKSLK